MKTTNPAEVGKALKDLAERLSEMKMNSNSEKTPRTEEMFNYTVNNLKEVYATFTHMASNFTYINERTKNKLAEQQYSTESEWIERGYSIEQSRKLEELEKQLHEELMNTYKKSQKKVELSNE